jgi:hypothetical protein
LTTMFLYTSDLLPDFSHIGVACLVVMHITYIYIYIYALMSNEKLFHLIMSQNLFARLQIIVLFILPKQCHAKTASEVYLNKSCLATSFIHSQCYDAFLRVSSG